MFNVGGGELIVIMLIALIVLGPQRLPGAARQIGKTMGDLRRLSSGFQNEVRTALNDADDPDRVAARRNVLAKESPLTADAAVDAESVPVSTEVGSSSSSPDARAAKPAARRAPLKAKAIPRAAPRAANGTAVPKGASTARRGAGAGKASTKKVAAKTTSAKKTAAKKTAAKPATRRSTSR
jgi:sec-independent protein translocase protein TatB